jgi:antitoxin CptB
VTLPDDLRKKRLLFRSWHRGTREADLILGRFAEAHLAGFDRAQLDRYEALLHCSDAEIFDWVAGRASLPAAYDHDVTRLLLAFRPCPSPQPSPRRSPDQVREGEGGTRDAGE